MSAHRNIKLLSWFNFFCDFVPFSALATIYFSQITGSLALGMSIFSIGYLSAALFEVPTGIFSDRVGRRKTIIYGACCNIIAVTLYAIGGAYWILASGALFMGIARAFFSGNNEALLHDTLTQLNKQHEFTHHLGRTNSMFQIALAISGILGSFLAAWSLSLMMWVSVIPQIIALIISVRFVEPEIHAQKSTNIYAHFYEALTLFKTNKKLRLISIASILRFGFGEAVFFFRSALYQLFWPIWAIGFGYALSHIGSSIGYYFSGRVLKRFGTIRALNGEIIINRFITLFAFLVPGVLTPIILAATSLFYGVAEVAKSGILHREFTHHQRATLGSLNSLFGNIFFAVFAVGLGYLGDVLGPIRTYISIQLLFLIILVVYWQFAKLETAQK